MQMLTNAAWREKWDSSLSTLNERIFHSFWRLFQLFLGPIKTSTIELLIDRCQNWVNLNVTNLRSKFDLCFLFLWEAEQRSLLRCLGQSWRKIFIFVKQTSSVSLKIIWSCFEYQKHCNNLRNLDWTWRAVLRSAGLGPIRPSLISKQIFERN